MGRRQAQYFFAVFEKLSIDAILVLLLFDSL